MFVSCFFLNFVTCLQSTSDDEAFDDTSRPAEANVTHGVDAAVSTKIKVRV